MPTTFSDQFWEIDPGVTPPVGTQLEVLKLRIVDQNENNFIGVEEGDTIAGSIVELSYAGDTVTVMLIDGSSVTITGSTFILVDGRTFFTPSDGSVLQTSSFQSATAVPSISPIPVSTFGPPCFVSGTFIQTAFGSVPVENLMAGDVVRGVDEENVTIRKVLSRQISARELHENPNFRPIRITAGALGSGLPARDLLISRQHRMLISSLIAKNMFGTADVLISAIKLTELPGIYIDETVNHVTYVHLIFDKHELIFAENAPTESLLLGPMALNTMSPEAEREIREIFPTAFDLGWDPEPIRLIPTNKMQKEMIRRHLNDGVPIGL